MNSAALPVVISAPHESIGAKILVELARPKKSGRTLRLFSEWAKTDFGSECSGFISNNGWSQKTILQIGGESGIHIKENPKKYRASFMVGKNPRAFTILVHPKTNQNATTKLANELAAHVGKGCPVPAEIVKEILITEYEF